ncbi:hypothetical protein EHQ31_18690 [Leptospira montravelensis]|uniref:Uncharacterized protein n=1 Tax=Leptospira montravelensis TaxID=2484961 RepID=A0ABY2LL13_9LEPT|nr:hypothetical protein [Leptospira montravelensis]TGK86127.1 hypothetical protein EHQ19_01785 [Leptospira montravelensis]TGK95011.1 hypothetical protein EHQ31_18690 [Leptospira montravelensis]
MDTLIFDLAYITDILNYLIDNKFLMTFKTENTDRLGLPIDGEQYLIYDHIDPNLQKDIIRLTNLTFLPTENLYELKKNNYLDSEELRFRSEKKHQKLTNILSISSIGISFVSLIASGIIGFKQVYNIQEIRISEGKLVVEPSEKYLETTESETSKIIEAIKESKKIIIKNKIKINNDQY